MSFARTSIVASTLLAVLTACESEKKTTPTTASTPAVVEAQPAKPLTVEESASVSMTAKVKAIDYVTREITLEDASGHSVTLVAGKEIQRLNEVRVGDKVTIDYVVSLLAELRPPTADEVAHPIASVDIAGRSPQGTAPAGGVMRATRVVTTVQAVDLPNMLVTLKGPMGDMTTIHARNPDNVKKLRVGDTIVITYAQAVGVSLVRASSN